jgi:hypothetical protein
MIPDERRAKPVVLLAFANEQGGRRYLPSAKFTWYCSKSASNGASSA